MFLSFFFSFFWFEFFRVRLCWTWPCSGVKECLGGCNYCYQTVELETPLAACDLSGCFDRAKRQRRNCGDILWHLFLFVLLSSGAGEARIQNVCPSFRALTALGIMHTVQIFESHWGVVKGGWYYQAQLIQEADSEALTHSLSSARLCERHPTILNTIKPLSLNGNRGGEWRARLKGGKGRGCSEVR